MIAEKAKNTRKTSACALLNTENIGKEDKNTLWKDMIDEGFLKIYSLQKHFLNLDNHTHHPAFHIFEPPTTTPTLKPSSIIVGNLSGRV